jgi:hypothetical protein
LLFAIGARARNRRAVKRWLWRIGIDALGSVWPEDVVCANAEFLIGFGELLATGNALRKVFGPKRSRHSYPLSRFHWRG